MPDLDAVEPSGLTLRVRFMREADRYSHAILAVESGGRERLLLASLEGTPDDGFPPSPPLQSLSIEELAPGRRAALLVGMAGRGHWSASVEAVPGRAALVFDIACRWDAASAALRSTYRLQAGVEEAPYARIIPQEASPGGSQLERRGRQAVIVPSPVASALPTVRWRYCIELSEISP
jgi:hypothetical protein